TVLDRDGRITLWNDALARLSGRPRERALGRTIVEAMPALVRSELPRRIDEALHEGIFFALTDIALREADGTRIVRVETLPDVDGVAIGWQDITEHARTDDEARRAAARLTLAAEGANDGLWEWDLRGAQLYVSPRWRALLGLGARNDAVHPREWLDR